MLALVEASKSPYDSWLVFFHHHAAAVNYQSKSSPSHTCR
jgi:hypothetical protein